jgi:spore germination cell wall hydrolase CwlJ-like protein
MKIRDLPFVGLILLMFGLTYANGSDEPREVEHEVMEVEHEVMTVRPTLPEVIVIDPIVLEADDAERELMAQIVMNEAEGEPQDGKQAVAQVIVNRVLSPLFPDTIRDVIYEKYQFATSGTKTPTQECYEAVDAALKYEGFPPNMFYFRNEHYHTFGKPYCQIGNHYFSTED